MFGKLFRRCRDDGDHSSSLKLKQTLAMLEEKECLLQKKVSVEVERAKVFTKSKNKQAALECLKRKRYYESQIEHLESFQSRIHDQRAGSTPIPGSYDRPPFFVGAPPPMPLGIGGGYGHPPSFPGMRYDYGQPGNAAGPYGLLSSYGPPGHIGGLGYGPGMSMDGYGFGYRGSPLPVTGAWPGGDLPDNNASRKRRGGPDGLSEGDWVCPKCQNVNFAFRTTCNMKKCSAPKPLSGPNRSSSGSKDTGSGPEGSWTCNKCGNLNYPFRTVCNRKGCSNEKPLSS
ncbi:hypothetical protein QJS04_geneDACA018406 [Acorus gramineus]|uniref:RanBP2-type domain-containing protein n=1 Tax=Acorus gramineus TaxID=55184 RepID=A0AAV9ADP9_ACOGR|nr:hypothetical protein QJS04_geneDACA018406 [Acorus gramineus]